MCMREEVLRRSMRVVKVEGGVRMVAYNWRRMEEKREGERREVEVWGT